MVLQVHDELVFDVPEAELEKVEALVREEMEGAVPLDVPLVVDIGSGTTGERRIGSGAWRVASARGGSPISGSRS